ncbi:MAG TPA: hypothetical protein VLH77_06250, partial [Gammaproteobacteria bacterium]|nr:hypothetical protein [Gammaproteobacteria bacterium]
MRFQLQRKKVIKEGIVTRYNYFVRMLDDKKILKETLIYSTDDIQSHREHDLIATQRYHQFLGEIQRKETSDDEETKIDAEA